MSLMIGIWTLSKNRFSCLRKTLWIMKITKAPTATPQTFPMPPRTTMARTVNDTSKRKRFGVTVWSLAAMKTPARPAVDAPSAKARSFVTMVLTPLAAAASSSSRIAAQARPSRESWSR